MKILNLGIIFFITFFITFLILVGIVKIIHIIRKDKSKKYRIAVLIFSLLTAIMVTFLNIGR